MKIIKRHHFLLSLFYCGLFIWLIALYQGSPAFQQTVNSVVGRAQLFTQQQVNHLLGKKVAVKQQNSSQAESKGTVTDGRWPENSTTIYIDLSNPTLRAATTKAIDQWNQTGAFTFRPVQNKTDANIVITAVDRQQNGAAGLTNTKTDATTGYLLHADVQLNAGYLLNANYGYSPQRIVNTAEHELGHAIGLQHTNATSVMQPAGSFYPIQPTDVEAVKRLYQKRPHPADQQTVQRETSRQ
ncbi:matrixin family metalloprotease [Limosilactobacillus oris]|uniref:matrixin family metalloprotease n=1 Tax=Limosilactobacillus oris TaxID=1632 RepID=UPI0024B3756E|nr:matrixin family metalloprotease [Limosilactobacillus oris]WHO85113.1 matrixin family metalloprotease [Limosilactobacillus oris]